MNQREIKFRAWDDINKKMFPADTIEFFIDKKGEQFFLVKHRKENALDDLLSEKDRYYQLGTGFPLMQFTGLKDKNGKEIYEGDVVLEGRGRENDFLFVVEWQERMASEFLTMSGWALRKLRGEWTMGGDYDGLVGDETTEIIGNIYENPELL